MFPKKILSFISKEFVFIFGLVLVLFIKVIELNPVFIDNFYDKYYFTPINTFSEFLFGRFEFSFGDILYLILPFLLYSQIKKSHPRRKNTFIFIKFSLVIYIIFQIQWGVNYHRTPLHKKLSLKSNYTFELLKKETKKIIDKTNQIHKKLSNNDTVAIDLIFNKKFIIDESIQSLKKVEFINDIKIPKNIKISTFSTINSYMGFGGYINPITLEAQINDNTPRLFLPTTITHEISHQLGYAAEDEANFIGILSCMKSENDFISYCGHVQAVRYLLNEIFNINSELYKKMVKELNTGVKKNIAEAAAEIDEYKNPLEPLFKKFYDNFLKINNQPKGIKSYNSVVNLIVNYGINP